jgi:hypothetical protein
MVTTMVLFNRGNLGPKVDGHKYLIGRCHVFILPVVNERFDLMS